MKNILTTITALVLLLLLAAPAMAQKKSKKKTETSTSGHFDAEKFASLQWRNAGPFRGGRAVAATGVPGDPLSYYFGSVGGGLWKSEDAGLNWRNVSDGFFKSGSVGAVAVAPSDVNVVYVGMGEHAIRGVMTSQGDGVYKSTDAGKTWKHVGLEKSLTISSIRIHPQNPDLVYVAVQGSQWSDSEDRGVYLSRDGGATWEKSLYVDEKTGPADLSMDPSNPRILYAAMWDHRREPWRIRSGGEGSGIHKSTDAGKSWTKINEGLPEVMGKISVAVSPANGDLLYANIEAEGEKAGVYRSANAGKNWQQVSKDRNTVARAWYYIKIVADPADPETVYVLNTLVMKSIDGGKNFSPLPAGHVDQHYLWINPDNAANMIVANDGGSCITFNGGKSWSSQNNQPTAQFYRVIADDQFPYHIYGGQQDNSTVCLVSKTIYGGISESDWYAVAGGESAFLAFNNPQDPEITYGTSIQGMIDMYDKKTGMSKDIMSYPSMNLGSNPKDQKYRFNWNGPLIHNRVNPKILYQGANQLLRSDNGGQTWTEISPDLTRNDSSKHTETGIPFTNETAGGEVYNTISYIVSSAKLEKVIWVGSDDGLVHVTKDEGETWIDVSPAMEGEALINAIELSPHEEGSAYLAVTRYKFDDHQPLIFYTEDYGEHWKKIVNGLPADQFVRVVREDPLRRGLLYAGTENGLHISFNNGSSWFPFQSNLPVTPITDLIIKDNDLVAATSGRGFWILDDLSALQQSAGVPDTLSLKLFAPKTTYRFSLGGGFEKGNVGQNPWPGIILDYYLPHDLSDTSALTLEIFDADGKLVRSLSNKSPEGFKSWPGGPPSPKLIPAKPGLNRTNWDMTRESLPAVDGIFVFGGLNGSTVGPGSYTLRLGLDSIYSEQSVILKADPRIGASEEDYRRQQMILVQIENIIKELQNSVSSFRSVKNQLNEKLELLKENEGSDDLIKAGEDALTSLKTWEEKLIEPARKTFQDVVNFENRLISELNMLKIRADSYDPRVNIGIEERMNELYDAWQVLNQEKEEIIIQDLEAFNKLYKQEKTPALIIPKME